MREARARELTRVMDKTNIDQQLLSKCAYYPLFRFIDFINKKTGERIRGQQLICKECSMPEPNPKCKHHINLVW